MEPHYTNVYKFQMEISVLYGNSVGSTEMTRNIESKIILFPNKLSEGDTVTFDAKKFDKNSLEGRMQLKVENVNHEIYSSYSVITLSPHKLDVGSEKNVKDVKDYANKIFEGLKKKYSFLEKVGPRNRG